jgi:hypothetical protein
MRTIKLIFFGLVLFVLGWFANLFFDNYIFDRKKKENKIIADTIANQVKRVNEALITNLKHDKKIDSYFRWKTNHADTTNYQCEIEMADQYMVHWFHGQCAYYYFTFVTSDTIVNMLWSYKTDCILNMDFLEKSHGEKEFPKKGDLFATYTMTNDSTLKAKYYFPKWTHKINEIAQDSLFAIYYHMR